tara:strand:+ start:8456 stop:8950 length:495 start_codon:yes stop_codon:yes gene_type:complete
MRLDEFCSPSTLTPANLTSSLANVATFGNGGGLCRYNNRSRSGDRVTFGLCGRSVNCVKSSGGRLYPPESSSSPSRRPFVPTTDAADAAVPRDAATRPRHARRARATNDVEDVDDASTVGLARFRDDMTTTTRAHARCIDDREARCEASEGRSALRSDDYKMRP